MLRRFSFNSINIHCNVCCVSYVLAQRLLLVHDREICWWSSKATQRYTHLRILCAFETMSYRVTLESCFNGVNKMVLWRIFRELVIAVCNIFINTLKSINKYCGNVENVILYTSVQKFDSTCLNFRKKFNFSTSFIKKKLIYRNMLYLLVIKLTFLKFILK